MPSAWIIEEMPDGSERQRGRHEFIQLPATGDRISLQSDDGLIQMFGVVCVEHSPVRITGDQAGEPSAIVSVTHMRDLKIKAR